MPHCSITIGPQGPLLVVYIGVSAPRKIAMHAAGVPIPAPVTATLIVDTGASCTSIDKSLIAQLGLKPTGETTILTPSTGSNPHLCSTYDVEMFIPGAPSSKHIPALAIIDGSYLSHGHHGLLGRDVLREGRLVYSGPDALVMLSF